MNRKLKIILIYLVIGVIAIRIPSEIFRDTWLNDISVYLLVIVVVAMLFHFGTAMENKQARKRYYIGTGLIVGQLIVFQVLIALLGINVTTWGRLSIVGFTVPFLTLFVMLLAIAKAMDATNNKISLILRVLVVFSLIIFIPVSVILVLG